MFGIKTKIKLCRLKLKWMCKHTRTVPMSLFPEKNVSVGKESYGELNITTFNNKSKLIIGNYVSIAQDVTFLLDADHKLDTLSTYPFNAKVLGEGDEATSKGNILIDDDVWIGYGATILSGIHIGQGAVVAAGAVVSKDIEPYAIVGGVPAKVIKYRFEKQVIDYLLTLDYSKLDKSLVQEHVEELYLSINNMKLEDIKKLYDWFPKKP